MILVQPCPVDPRVPIAALYTFAIQSVVPLHDHQVLVVIFTLQRPNLFVVQYPFAVCIVFDPNNPVLFVIDPTNLIISGVTGNGFIIRAEIPFSGLVLSFVEFSENLTIGIFRSDRLSVGIIPSFAGGVTLINICPLYTVIVIFYVNNSIVMGAIIRFLNNGSIFIICPSDFSAAVFIRESVAIQKIGNPNKLLLFVILATDFIIAIFSGNRVPDRIQIVIGNVVASFIIFPENLTIGFTLRRHRLPAFIEPGFPGYLFARVVFFPDFRISVGIMCPPPIRAVIDYRKHIAEFIQGTLFPGVTGSDGNELVFQSEIAGLVHPAFALIDPPDHSVSTVA